MIGIMDCDPTHTYRGGAYGSDYPCVISLLQVTCLLFVQKFCLQAEPRVTKLETDFQTAKVT